MTLDEWIEQIEEYQKELLFIDYSDLLSILKELRDRRESELRPATRFLSKGWYQQIQHVYSEFNEVITEFHLFDDGDVTEPLKLIEELIDLQMSCETMLACMELNEQQRMEARRRVIAKNKARGYYQEESV